MKQKTISIDLNIQITVILINLPNLQNDDHSEHGIFFDDLFILLCRLNAQIWCSNKFIVYWNRII